ncbi:hypothetical protein [Actinomadura madurae]|uniref:hypothetical protein n=1 Tax=Actinomadura madurae TaxID=1993 RepID=UPI0039995D1E
MFGKTRHGIAYFACQPERQHHKDRADWYSEHPKSLWVREDVLLDGARHFFAERIFGPRRQTHLRDQLRRSASARADSVTIKRGKQLKRELTDLQRRQDNLITQLETFESTGDADADRDYRQSVQRRFAELTATRRAKQAELDQLNADTSPGGDDADLLDLIPHLPLNLSELSEDLERRLFDAFQLQIRYNRTRHEATFRVTVRADTVKMLIRATESVTERGPDMQRDDDQQASRSFPSSRCPLQDSNLRTRLRRPPPIGASTCTNTLRETTIGRKWNTLRR